MVAKDCFTEFAVTQFCVILCIFCFFQGYYRRAEALKALLSSPQLRDRIPQSKSFADVVSDYCASHRIKPLGPSLLCETLILAVDHSKSTMSIIEYYRIILSPNKSSLSVVNPCEGTYNARSYNGNFKTVGVVA